MQALALTESERAYLATLFAVPDYAISEETETTKLPRLAAFNLRTRILDLYLHAGEGEAMLPVSTDDLWALDTLLVDRDLRKEKLPDGSMALELAKKVWRLLTEEDDDLNTGSILKDAEALLKEEHNASAE